MAVGGILGYIIGRGLKGEKIEIPIVKPEPIEEFDVLFYSTTIQAGQSKEIAKIETETSRNTRILYIGHCWHEKTRWKLDTKGRASIHWQTQLGTPASLFWLNYQVPQESKVVIDNNDTVDHNYTVILGVSKGYTKASGLTDADLCTDILSSSDIEVEVAKKKTTPITRTIQNHGGTMWWQGG